ncbi:MAG: alanine--tRNA ligase [Vampirovibrionales bacterium]|nr:alanine--tRNA ligase [Vampirovibrionales bacterium]
MTPTGTLSGQAIREKFLSFFSQKYGHKITPSASLVPTNPTVLLTPAGMLPFVPIFLGIEPAPKPPRAVSSQKCARVSGKASDLEYVGRTPRHHTFFEMLGNFSFGDYFKEQAIAMAWEFITEEVKLPKDKLWITVFETDLESRDIWRDKMGVPEERILFCGAKDNFWGPPGATGPCGPCSEIHYDHLGESRPEWKGDPSTNPALLESDRFVEVWNLVFMELFKDGDGKLSPLEKKNVDTGMGLERITMVLQGKENTFETDLLFPLVDHAAKLAKVHYKKGSPQTDTALKILADHIRCVSFAVADGIIPSNEGRGYIIRMLLRRAVRYGKQHLNLQGAFLHQMVSTVRDLYQAAYPELKEKYQFIVDTVKAEENRFLETLERGSKRLEELIEEAKASNNQILSGDEIFKLYDTYGFPLELTADIAKEKGFSVDEDGFEAAMKAQKQQARSARKGDRIVDDQVYSRILEEVGPTKFVGYDTLSAQATVKALIVEGEQVEAVGGTNQAFEAVLDVTPFYAESGGQVGDRGSFSRDSGPHGLTVVVSDVMKVGELFVHQCLFDNGGNLRVGETLSAQVDPVSRQLSAIHHTATHLIHAALRKVLGDQVAQAGSYVSSEGARFDFTFNRALSPVELQRVEFIANKEILSNSSRLVEEMDIDSAKQSGAIAMFDEKYADLVRVISYGAFTKELCGGTHVNQLGEIGLIKITSEGAIASGVRRIEYVAGEKAYRLFKQVESEMQKTAGLLKAPVSEVPAKIEKLLEELKAREKSVRALEEKIASGEVKQMLQAYQTYSPWIVTQVDTQRVDGLKMMAEKLADQLGSKTYVVLLASNIDQKAHFVSAVSKNLVAQGISAGELVKKAAAICEGGGGGRPNFAQAGGKNPAKIVQALAEMNELIQQTVSVPAS